MQQSNIPRLVTSRTQFEEGLFGQVLLQVFEVLPHLARRQFRPHWHICSMHYGRPADGLTIPGVVDIAYAPRGEPGGDVDLMDVRERHCAVLGSNWTALNALWTRYFRVPGRITAAADALGPFDGVLGIHYRGNDKNTADWDTNPVSHDDYLAIVADFAASRPDLTRLFVASDDGSFAGAASARLGREVINLGDPGFHKDAAPLGDAEARADAAMLDCVLLSRCVAVLQTSSGLSSFAKVLRPELEIYRCAASKMYTDIPYFPVAYIPKYQSADREVQAVVDRLMRDDWTGDPRAAPFLQPFTSRPRPGRKRLLRRVLELFTGSPLAASRIRNSA